ncbi:MAG: hypothetical protein JWP27_2943, partial [Flaviaesturariibacter sp.]|nr:hypothetical protein [Flaviaesturariibacter sp.]
SRLARFGSAPAGPQAGTTSKLRGDLALALGSPSTAIRWYQNAISRLYPAFIDPVVRSSPKQFTNAFSYIYLFDAIIAKAEAFHRLYETGHAIADAEAELDAYTSAFGLLSYTSQTYDSDEARLFLEQSRYRVHGRPIAMAFDLFRQTGRKDYLETAYRFDQSAKASVLAFNEMQNARVQPNDPLLRQERALRADITRLSLMAARRADTTGQAERGRQITDREIALGNVRAAMGKKYRQPAAEIPPTSKLQALLDHHTALLSYHLDEGTLTVFVVTATTFNGTRQPLPPTFRPDLVSLVSSLHGAAGPLHDSAANARLYRLLIGNHGLASYKRLVLIPDDELLYIPFEALWDGEKFVVEKASVQYQYSTVLLEKETGDLENGRTVSFAPFARSGTPDFARLPFSRDEAASTGGPVLSDSSATKEAFLRTVGSYDIIHLATHAVASDSNDQLSFIAFARGRSTADSANLLYAPEIANLSLRDNKLIILSACETGGGRLVKGEGLMSLSRAFAYAGCPDIVTSLWKADDEATAFLGQAFHSYLRKGQTVDDALASAKRDYLASPRIHPRKKSPAYWAHLVYIGNYQPQNRHAVLPWLPALAGLLILGIFVAARVRRRSKAPQAPL